MTSSLFKQRKFTSNYVNTSISNATAAKNLNRELLSISRKENRTGIPHAKSFILDFTSVIKVQTKVRFLLVENKLLSVDTALQAHGYIRTASTHITPNEKQCLLVYRSESDFECLQILMILPVSKYGGCPIFRNRSSRNASVLRSTICFVFRWRSRMYVYIQINENALSLEETNITRSTTAWRTMT